MYKVGGAAKKRLVPLEDKQTGGSSTGLFEVRPPSNAGKDWPAQSDTRMNEYQENEEGGCATSNHRSMGPFFFKFLHYRAHAVPGWLLQAIADKYGAALLRRRPLRNGVGAEQLGSWLVQLAMSLTRFPLDSSIHHELDRPASSPAILGRRWRLSCVRSILYCSRAARGDDQGKGQQKKNSSG